MVFHAVVTRVGRHLLDHCFTVTGGEDHHAVVDNAVGGEATNATAVVGADAWAGVAVDSGVHADRYSVRVIFWLVHTLAAGLGVGYHSSPRHCCASKHQSNQ
jgi:hypothetical protein